MAHTVIQWLPFRGEVGKISGSSSQGIFLSYRREDSAPHASSLQLQLSQRLPDAQVFMDLDSIEPGLDFVEIIEQAVSSCAVLVAVIGRQWATLADERGDRRLDNPDDFVRFEVQAALERGIRVIPVLVDGARPLRRQDLPEEMHKLARLNAHTLSYARYKYDTDQLVDLIQKVLAPIREREEAERQAREEAHRKAQEEEEAKRLAQEEAARKEAERKARQAEQRRARRKAAQEAEQKAAREAELKTAQEPERKAGQDSEDWVREFIRISDALHMGSVKARRAAEKMSPAEAFIFGEQLEKRGNVEGAAAAYDRAAGSRDREYSPRAANKLGYLFEKQANVPGARAAYQRAADSHHPDHAPLAARSLARLRNRT